MKTGPHGWRYRMIAFEPELPEEVAGLRHGLFRLPYRPPQQDKRKTATQGLPFLICAPSPGGRGLG